MEKHRDFSILGVTPFGQPNARLVTALCRAGAVGVLDLGRDAAAADASLASVCERVPGQFGVRISEGSALPSGLPAQVSTVLVDSPEGVARVAALARGRRILVEVTSVEEAEAAERAGASGLIAKGEESGGRVGSISTFILLQLLAHRESRNLPIWAQGGIGLHTAAACAVAGAVGVVLDSQLALVRESELVESVRSAVRAMDGSETTVVAGHRVYTRPDLPVASRSHEEWTREEVVACLGARDLRENLLPVGQDGGLASGLSDRFKTAGGVVVGLQRSVAEHLRAAQSSPPLARNAPFADSHSLEYPIAQGPMTRVSDCPAFTDSVAEEGGLPFVGLALMRGPEVRAVLEEVKERLGERTWGVGILGFVPKALREEQLEVLRELHPPVALIAGGRPAQAAPLEREGTATYLHVPSPGLLRQFFKDGARRFVFEGRECGGHVGPRTSFALWETQIAELLREDALDDVHVLFAGGIHDALSSAMVGALAAELADRGAKVGVLMGTAYLFTREAVETGAIQPGFQSAACEGGSTVLLETSPGHAVRGLDSPYTQEFLSKKEELAASGKSTREAWAELEELNLGRLRIATKGLRRDGGQLVTVDAEEQRREGMFMIGECAALRDRVVGIADLHQEISDGGSARLSALEVEAEIAAPAEPLEIAIVGMACVFPGSPDADAFWANVVAGTDAVTEVPESRWSADEYYHPDAVTHLAGEKTPSKWGGFLPAIPFDALGYGIPPKSLPSIEPVQLLSLEVASRALADAGYADREFDRDRTAVIFGAEAGTDLSGAYGFRALYPQLCGELPEAFAAGLPRLTEDSFPGVLTNVIAGRIANRLDLRGVNYTVDAACAASLAALDQSCKELLVGSADMVLCGGADLHNGINDYLLFSSVHALSPTGRCRPFDSQADGIALGEGVACVVLKRLSDAQRDGDRVYAVIQGVGGSSDGKCLGLTAPRFEGQELSLQRAYDRAGIEPNEVGLVEAHGTGTVVGDRTELEVLTEAFLESGAEAGSCALGSVKSQIGHTKCAAGLAGIIKTSRALYHGVLPPTLHIRQPNDYYKAETSPFRFSNTARPWEAPVRRAAVSAFGFGGSNFHAVLANEPAADRPGSGLAQWPAELVLVRGEDRAAAVAEIDRLTDVVRRCTESPGPSRLRDLAFGQCAESAAPVQVAIVAESFEDLGDKLARAREFGESRDDVFFREPMEGKLAFLFPGQGSQRTGMLGDLFIAFPALQTYLARGSEWAPRIYPGAVYSRDERAAQQQELTDTRVAQPALGMVELALASLLAELGLEPDMLGGHSYGELAALCVAGALAEDDLLALSAARGEAILAAAPEDPGAMAAVEGSFETVREAVAQFADVVIANDNSPTQVVLSGPTESVEAAVEALTSGGFNARRIPVACAFHSPVVEGASDALARRLGELPVEKPGREVWSNVTAGAYPSDSSAVRDLLAAQVARPVRFREQIEAMYEAGARIFVEVGPGRVLSRLVQEIVGDRPGAVVPCDVAGEPGVPNLLSALARLVTLGVPVDTRILYRDRDARKLEAESSPAHSIFLVDGHTVAAADGSVLPGALPRANEMPRVELAHGAVSASEDAVLSYLQGMREAASAQREVMLRYLGAEPEALAPRSAPRELAARHVEAQAVEPARAEARVAMTGDDLMAVILAIVSERTGYPEDMLEPDLDLEADLSIDSIKRAEILAELAERVALPGVDEDELDESVVEELAALKTLREIVDWIGSHLEAEAGGEGAPADRAAAASAPRESQTAENSAEIAPARPRRYRMELAEVEGHEFDATAVEGRRFLVAGSGCGLARALADRLESHGGRVRCAVLDEAPEQDEWIIHLGPVADPVHPLGQLFGELRASALGGAKGILVVTGMGGSFGIHEAAGAGNGSDSFEHAGAGVRGLVKTFAREFPHLDLRVVDVERSSDPEELATRILKEVSTQDRHVEVAHRDDTRVTTRMVERPGNPSGDLGLGPDSVVLITGGARGLGARTALALAESTGCRLELVGRSPRPTEAEPEDLAAATDDRSLRRALIERGDVKRPAEIERECARILGAREMRATFEALDAMGARYRYHQADVGDAHDVSTLLADIYSRFERLDGVVHAAGILEDKLIRDKGADSFQRVFDTKVVGAQALARGLRDDFRFFAMFGSVSGVFGNRGQVDYAAANCALGTLSRSLNRVREGRVVTIHWGPWAAGMVSPELAREYSRRGIALIDPDEGIETLLEELRSGDEGDAEVVLMCGDPSAFAGPGHLVAKVEASEDAESEALAEALAG